MKGTGCNPDTREMASMVLIGKRIMLFGGLSHSTHPQVSTFDLKTGAWTEKNKEEKSNSLHHRSAHSAQVHNKTMWVFGGEVHDLVSRHSEMTSDIQ